MLVTKLARVYAKALIELASERKVQEEVQADWRVFLELFGDSREFANMLKSPVLKDDLKVEVLQEIFTGKIHQLTMEFLILVTRQGREEKLPVIAKAYKEMLLKRKGIQQAVVTTAYALSEQELKEVNNKVAELTDSKIELENRVDSDLIGGMVLRVGDRQYNGSVALELRNLRREFKQNVYVADF